MEDSARLLIRIGGKPETQYSFDQEITIVGREAINDLMLNDPEVSRRHCRFIVDQDGYLIEDLGSTNGTFVNGQRVTAPMMLYNGDTIELGKTVRLTFYGGSESQKTQPFVRPTADLNGGTYTNHPPFSQDAPPPPPSRAPVRQPEQPQPSSLPVNEVVGDRSAEYYEQQPDPPVIETVDDLEESTGGCQRYIIGCGCSVLVLLFLIGITLFILDRAAPEFLYCGPIRSIWEALLNLAGRSLAC